MKNILYGLVFSLFFVSNVLAGEGDINLPAPNKTGGTSLMETLSNRQSKKVFSGKHFDNQMISNVLWAAFGVNRQDVQKRTIPTAKNSQNLEVYVALPEGLYKYDGIENKLSLIVLEDFRGKTGKQSDLLKNASMILIYVEKLGDAYNKFNTGAASQNVGLYAAAFDLSSFVVGSANIKELGQILKLSKGYQVQIVQPIGY